MSNGCLVQESTNNNRKQSIILRRKAMASTTLATLVLSSLLAVVIGETCPEPVSEYTDDKSAQNEFWCSSRCSSDDGCLAYDYSDGRCTLRRYLDYGVAIPRNQAVRDRIHIKSSFNGGPDSVFTPEGRKTVNERGLKTIVPEHLADLTTYQTYTDAYDVEAEAKSLGFDLKVTFRAGTDQEATKFYKRVDKEVPQYRVERFCLEMDGVPPILHTTEDMKQFKDQLSLNIRDTPIGLNLMQLYNDEYLLESLDGYRMFRGPNYADLRSATCKTQFLEKKSDALFGLADYYSE